MKTNVIVPTKEMFSRMLDAYKRGCLATLTPSSQKYVDGYQKAVDDLQDFLLQHMPSEVKSYLTNLAKVTPDDIDQVRSNCRFKKGYTDGLEALIPLVPAPLHTEVIDVEGEKIADIVKAKIKEASNKTGTFTFGYQNGVEGASYALEAWRLPIQNLKVQGLRHGPYYRSFHSGQEKSPAMYSFGYTEGFTEAVQVVTAKNLRML